MPVRALRLWKALRVVAHVILLVEERRMPVRALRLRRRAMGRFAQWCGGTKNARQGIETSIPPYEPVRGVDVEERRMPVRALRPSLRLCNPEPRSCGGTKNARQGIETSPWSGLC